MRKKKKVNYYFILLILFIGIGFAYLSTNLSMLGIGTLHKNKWDVHFENVNNISDESNIPELVDNTTISFFAPLYIPGDEYSFSVDIVNAGSINAMIDSINYNVNTTASSSLYTLRVEYESNNQDLNIKDGILAGNKDTIRCTMIFNKDISIEDLPNEEIEFNVNININYVIADKSAKFNVFEGIYLTNNGEALSNSNLVIYSDTPHYIKTNEDGYFKIMKLEEGEHEVYLLGNEDMRGSSKEEIISNSISNITLIPNIGDYNDNSTNVLHVTYYVEDDNYDEVHDYLITDSFLDKSILYNVCDTNRPYRIIFTDTGISNVLENYVDVSSNQSGEMYAYMDGNTLYINTLKKHYHIKAPIDSSDLFSSSTNHYSQYVSYLDVRTLYTGLTTNMKNMFNNVGSSGDDVIIDNLDKLDVSSVTNFSGTFHAVGVGSNSVRLNGIEKWDVSNATDMSSMFGFYGGSGDSSRVVVPDLSNWDVSNVKDFSLMFSYFCNNGDYIDLSFLTKWNTSSATTMYSFFYYSMKNIKHVNIGDLSNFDMSKVKSLTRFFSESFKYCETVNISGIDKWDTSSVTNMEKMFYDSFYNITDYTFGDIGKWDVSNVTTFTEFLSRSFWKVNNLNIDLSNWNVSKVYTMDYMFNWFDKDGDNFTIGDLSRWDVSHVSNFKRMFYQCGMKSSVFNIGNIGNWEFTNATNVSEMFSFAGSSATTVYIGDISDWSFPKATSLSHLFSNAFQNVPNFYIGDFGKWDVSNMTDLSGLFSNVAINSTTFNIGDLSNWNVSKATNLGDMFYNTAQNVSIFDIGDISNWNTSKVTSIAGMFTECAFNATTFRIGDISKWDTSNVTSVSQTFLNTAKMANYTLDLSRWNVSKVTNTYKFNEGVETKVIAPVFN